MQAMLSGLVERLARDHPHIVVHTVLALKNGNRSRGGRPGGFDCPVLITLTPCRSH